MMRILDSIDAVIEAIGRVVSLLILAIIGIIIFEMVARGIFDAPSAWAHELGAWLQVAFIFLGGGYALKHGKFVRIDLLYARYSPKGKALVDATASTVLFALFCYVLVSRGFEFALKSFVSGETSATGAWDGPVFVAKSLVPIGSVLLALAWASCVIRALRDAFAPES